MRSTNKSKKKMFGHFSSLTLSFFNLVHSVNDLNTLVLFSIILIISHYEH